MTTTAFQYIFDNAESISINRRATTAQTISRNNTVRTVSRGGQVWRFEVSMPNGMRWSTLRPYIEAIDAADRYTPGIVQINNAGYNSWLTGYQGNSLSTSGFYANITTGYANATITANPATSSGYKFKAGDIVQVGTTGNVYSVTSDVAYNSNAITFNRPVLDTTGNVALTVGPNVTWTVICTQMPQWTIFARDQVSWSGSFVFYEVQA
jgi:hypothetical protein